MTGPVLRLQKGVAVWLRWLSCTASSPEVQPSPGMICIMWPFAASELSSAALQAMSHYGQSLEVLFYEVLDMPLREYEQLKHMKVISSCSFIF